MEIVLVLTVGVLCIICFMVGAKVSQAVSKGEKIEMPTVNPVKLYKEHEVQREEQKAQKKLQTVMDNIENYNGTSIGQKEVR